MQVGQVSDENKEIIKQLVRIYEKLGKYTIYAIDNGNYKNASYNLTATKISARLSLLS